MNSVRYPQARSVGAGPCACPGHPQEGAPTIPSLSAWYRWSRVYRAKDRSLLRLKNTGTEDGATRAEEIAGKTLPYL